MKKFIVFAVVLALLVPAAAFAKAEFSLGGFIKMDAYWDSTQNTKNINQPISRNNVGNDHRGNMRFTAQGSRFNFSIKGPKVFGAQTTGFIEMDFDSTTNQSLSASNIYIPRLRHAMFRLNWPETELLLGQYWSLFSSWYAEAAEDGPFQVGGTPTARLAQIRVTQKFLSDWSVMGLIGQANNAAAPFNANYSTIAGGNTNDGGSMETPQIQASVKYAHDWWGKAAYYGKPIPFTAQVMAGWQRAIARTNNVAVSSLDGEIVANGARINNTNVDPWLAMASLFIPVMPTHSANLGGTASILTQFWIGNGVGAFGFTGDGTSVFKVNRFDPRVGFNPTLLDVELIKRWGGFVQGQYYFNNQWYANAAYSITKTYGIDQSRIDFNGLNMQESLYNNVNGQLTAHQQVDATLWYRPVQALKFGLQYAFVQTNWLTAQRVPAVPTGDATSVGTEHRVEFAGYFYF